ncbi:MarR family winged helix-turn-helix transcriptional regulator [Telluribacter humicola]|uniref:MarR family winged helix-turn-helix transcriptional regulator n=1 Tax=Telluribacter humicola TaxID=1720261 RepID=UPI001A972AC3|nr:MarR family winged helix-turn-helix transcriptional regulator [Telluribacter humicola]
MQAPNKIETPYFDRINPQYCINAKLRRLHRMLNAAYESKFKPFGLQGSMVSILFIIGKRRNVNQKAIANMLVLDQSTMSRDLKKLVEKGWVQVTKAKDPRHSELSLTREGYELLETIAPIWEKLHTTVEGILGKYNIQQLDLITEAIKSNLDDIKE